MNASATDAFDASPPQRRTARARREQRARASARVVSRLLDASAALACHRGCSPGQNLGEFACLLAERFVRKPPGGRPPGQGKPTTTTSAVRSPRPRPLAGKTSEGRW